MNESEKFRREAEMEQPVKDWLIELGYVVHRESSLYDAGIPDLLACLDRDFYIAVELKLRNFFKALSQARNYRRYAPVSFVAFPKKRARDILGKYIRPLKRQGIGLIAVEREAVTILLPAYWNREAQSERLWKRFVNECG